MVAFDHADPEGRTGGSELSDGSRIFEGSDEDFDAPLYIDDSDSDSERDSVADSHRLYMHTLQESFEDYATYTTDVDRLAEDAIGSFNSDSNSESNDSVSADLSRRAPNYQVYGFAESPTSQGQVEIEQLYIERELIGSSSADSSVDDDHGESIDIEEHDIPFLDDDVPDSPLAEVRGIFPAPPKLPAVEEERLQEVWTLGEASFSIFICPITHCVMTDPVVAADGYSYEREAITRWFGTSRRSPISNQRLPNVDLIPNYALRALLKTLIDATEVSGREEDAPLERKPEATPKRPELSPEQGLDQPIQVVFEQVGLSDATISEFPF